MKPGRAARRRTKVGENWREPGRRGDRAFFNAGRLVAVGRLKGLCQKTIAMGAGRLSTKTERSEGVSSPKKTGRPGDARARHPAPPNKKPDQGSKGWVRWEGWPTAGVRGRRERRMATNPNETNGKASYKPCKVKRRGGHGTTSLSAGTSKKKRTEAKIFSLKGGRGRPLVGLGSPASWGRGEGGPTVPGS